MTNKELQICKKQILKCLTENFKGNQAIFDKKEGWQVFNGTNLEMVMDSVVKGLKFAQNKITPGVKEIGPKAGKNMTPGVKEIGANAGKNMTSMNAVIPANQRVGYCKAPPANTNVKEW